MSETPRQQDDTQQNDLSRREFVGAAGAATAAGVLIGTSKTSWAGANERIRVAQLGIRGQGRGHIRSFNALENVEVATLCDVDENLFGERVKEFFTDEGLPAPKLATDMRRVFEDPEIDAVSIATPNHWHALASIWACMAGKDVYVEKPCSHNVFEGRQLVNAQRKYNRIVQHGTQIRSNPGIQEAIQHLREGTIGEVYMARGLCYRWRDSIGVREDRPVPEGVDYDLWLGPAPDRPFNPNRFHYNWHYHWDYGNGDIGNQGVHQMDIARWGLDVTWPTQVTSMAGMFLFDDQKEVPNVINTSFMFPDAGERGRMLVFDTRPWITNDEKGAGVGVLFYGSKGYMVIDSYTRYRIYMGREEKPGPRRDDGGNHYANFIAAMRTRQQELLNAPIEEGHYSSGLCHIGLISAKLGRSLNFDPAKEDFVGDAEASAMLTRPYRDPFTVPEIA